MDSKWIFRLLCLLVFGSLFALGFFFRTEPEKFWLVEGMALLSVIFFILLYRKLVRPYRIISNGINLLKEQDFSTRLRKVGNRQADEIIAIFNRMITHLKEQRLQVREKNQFLDLLIEASPQGVIILDLDGKVSEINTAARTLLGIGDMEAVRGREFKDCDFPLARELATLEEGASKVVKNPGQSIYRCTRSSFVDRGFDHPFLLIEELTHELRRIEKQSYENIIRMMSHEVNNSVAAIGATLEVVSEILEQPGEKDWSGVLPAVRASFERCGNLTRFTRNLADVVRIPEPSLSRISVAKLARNAVLLSMSEGMKRNIRFDIVAPDNDTVVMADAVQLEQVLLNIIKNAYEAIGKNGNITVVTTDRPASIIIEDDGPGIPPDAGEKLFTPFFSTKPNGQGVGLTFVKEVLSNHGFDYSLESREGKTRFTILFC
ncbi:MAG: ATP-binding protein [Alistipes sp.]|nr:ATP-binding protein [Alistipes sp.]